MTKGILKAGFLAATMIAGAAHAGNPLKEIGDHVEKGATGEAKRAGTEAVQGIIGNVIGGFGRMVGVDVGDCRSSSSTGVYSGTNRGAYENTRNTTDCDNNNRRYQQDSISNQRISETFNACRAERNRVERAGGHPIYGLDALCQEVLYGKAHGNVVSNRDVYGGAIGSSQPGHNYQQAPSSDKSVNDLLRSMRSR